MRWLKRGDIGKGAYGEVCSAWNVDGGELLAVKVLRKIPDKDRIFVKREVETLATVSHVCTCGSDPSRLHH